MRIHRAVFCLFLVAASGVTTVFGGDWAEMRFIGFSENGEYMAFEEYGEWDVHSGGTYATTYFIDVADNAYAIAPVAFDYSDNDDQKAGENSESARSARYREGVEAGIKRFGIVRGNTGKLVAAHMTSDHSFERAESKMGRFMLKGGKWIDGTVPAYDGKPLVPGYDRNRIIFRPFYYSVNPNPEDYFELKLRQYSSKKTCEARGVTFKDPAIFEMTLKDHTHHTNLPVQVLSRDRELPSSRGCATGYEMEQVYFYKDRLAVFVVIYTPGFPGSSLRYMAVTGQLDYETAK
jgi:predicted secreted protein